MKKRLEEAQKSCETMKEERDAAVADNGNLHEVVDMMQHGVDNRKEEYEKEVKQWEEERKDYVAQWKEWLDEKEKLKEELQLRHNDVVSDSVASIGTPRIPLLKRPESVTHWMRKLFTHHRVFHQV